MSAAAAVESGRVAAYLAVVESDTRYGWVDSTWLSEQTGVGPSQVRRDITAVAGQIGRRGVGYHRQTLARKLRAAIAGGAGAGVVLIAAEQRRRPGIDPVPGRVGELVREGARIANTIDALIAQNGGQ